MNDVRTFGARGDGVTDDAEAICRAIESGDGTLVFPRGEYLITRTVRVDLAKAGRIGLEGGAGTAKIVMGGAGPAFHILGTHEGSASPASFQPGVWDGERMPTVLNLEVEGKHPEADGFLIEGAMQPTFEGVTLYGLRDAIRVHRRCRNVLISHCHVYNNRGAGVFLDRVNLHQTIVTGSHISYCKRGGIKVIGSEIRNLQITGNDIEYNFDPDSGVSADIWIDASEERSSVREGTIVGNTIQAQCSPGGANVLMIGHTPPGGDYKAGMFTISDNLIGTQETNIHLVTCRGVVVSGNVIYGGAYRNLHVEHSQNIIVGSNTFDHNPDYHRRRLCTGLRFSDSEGCTLTGCIVQDSEEEQPPEPGIRPATREGMLEFVRCRRVMVTGCQVLDGAPSAIFAEDCEDVMLSGCALGELREEKRAVHTVRWKGHGKGNWVWGNRVGRGRLGALEIDDSAGVRVGENMVDGG